MDDEAIEVGKRLKIFRLALPGKVTQATLCKELAIKQGTYSMYESGARKVSRIIIRTLEQKYNLNSVWLETGEGDMFIESRETIISNLFPLLNKSNRALLIQLAKKIYVSQLHEEEIEDLI